MGTVLRTESCLSSKCRILWLLLTLKVNTPLKSVFASVVAECSIAFAGEEISMYLLSLLHISTWNTEKVLHSFLFQMHFFTEHLLNALRTRRKKHHQHVFIVLQNQIKFLLYL